MRKQLVPRRVVEAVKVCGQETYTMNQRKLSRRTYLRLSVGIFATTGLAVIVDPMKKAIGQVGGSRNLAENSRNRGLVNFETQLTKGLRTFLPQQVAFIKSVVQLVGQGKISRAMVNTVYVWARRRNPSVPYPYFEFALRALARKRGVVIP